MKAKSQKIGALEKVSFFLANVGNIPLMSLLSSFFTLFYTTIVASNSIFQTLTGKSNS